MVSWLKDEHDRAPSIVTALAVVFGQAPSSAGVDAGSNAVDDAGPGRACGELRTNSGVGDGRRMAA
jgi:hypothetical protein